MCKPTTTKSFGGGEKSLSTGKDIILDRQGIEHRVPSKKELKDCIPPQCFERSSLRSLALVVRDAAIIVPLFYLAWNFLPTHNIGIAGALAWTSYALLQGTALTGWWVLAHECGHGGFSDHTWLNDLVGYTLHTFLLVPYYAWQYSHAKHHAKCNHLLDGETHVANDKDGVKEYAPLYEFLGEDGFAVFQLFTHWVVGWPAYLIGNASGARRTIKGEPITTVHDHYRPSSKLFPETWYNRILFSTAGIVAMLGLFTHLSLEYGLVKMMLVYTGPYMVVNFWLVNYTWLQHTDEAVPHYGPEDWTWVKGALATVDRPYGVFDWFHHGIGSTHVVHHLFPSLPCYNAALATKHIKEKLGPLYNYDPTHFLEASWKAAASCHYVNDVSGTQYYKKYNGER